METLNPVVISFLACIYNKDVRQSILKDYQLKFEPLINIKNYVYSDDFKSKVINKENFNQCVNFTIKKMEDEKFREYLANNDICTIIFFRKTQDKHKNLLNNKTTKSSSVLSSLKSIMIKYEIVDKDVIIYTNPVASYKKRILDSKNDILSHFSSHGVDVTSVIVKYIYKDDIIDEQGETLLEIGFTIK